MKRWTHCSAFITGFIGMALLAGCNKPHDAHAQGTGTGSTASVSHDDEDHSHGTGPHGGTIFDLAGGKYHAEFCMNHGEKKATVYLYGPDAKKLLPVKAEQLTLTIKQPAFQIELKPVAQAGDPSGKFSCFAGTHDNFAKEQEFAGSLSGVIDGKPCNGDFAEKAESHGHDKKK